MDLPSEIMALIARGHSPDQVAEQLELDVVTVLQQIDRDSDTQLNRQVDYEPTPDQIRSACLEIQSGWNEQERHRRTAIHNPPASIPENVKSTC